MHFRGTVILLVVFALLGGYVYFTEFRGKEDREKRVAAEKKLVPFEPKEIAELTLSYDNTIITGVRKDGRWQITNPPLIEADDDAWESLSQSLSDIQREEGIAGNGSDLAQFGLDKPVLVVAVKLADGRTTQIQFGSENPRKTLNYLRVSDSSDVFLSSSKAEAFRKTLTELRNKKLLDVSPEKIDSVAFGAVSLKKASADAWELTKPLQAKADSTEVSTLLSTLQFARASGFADPQTPLAETGLDAPSLQLRLHDATEAADKVLWIGKMLEPGRYYARDASRPTVFIVDNQIPDKLHAPVFEWRDKSIVQIDRDKIQQIEIAHGADRFSFRKTGDSWTLADGRTLQWDKISSMLNTLDFEKAKDIIDSPKPLSAYGLDKPALELVFKFNGGPDLRVEFGSDSVMPPGMFLKQSGSAAVMVVSADVYGKFNVKVDDLVEPKSNPH